MKIKVKEKEINSYRLGVEIEREGQTYRASIYYDPHDGYDVTFLDPKGEVVEDPQWAQEINEKDLTYSLGYYLEDQTGGFFLWQEGEK